LLQFNIGQNHCQIVGISLPLFLNVCYYLCMRITFYGAAQDVTGSKHLVETQGKKLLLDCGMHQGPRSSTYAANSTLPFKPDSLDWVILSHAHLDHCGLLPLLVKQGYSKDIYCTHATAEISKFIMDDAAEVQKQDHDYLKRHIDTIQPPHPLFPPLYNLEDVFQVLPHFSQQAYFKLSKTWIDLTPDLRFKFYDAGHILGSAITLIETKEEGLVKRLAYTGDMGQFPVPMLAHPEEIQESPTENLIIECTYGDKNHKPNSEALEELKKIILSAAEKKRVILMPAFALGRVQEIIYMLHELYDQSDIPKIPIYVDSPLAEKLIPIFEKHIEDYSKEVWNDFGSKHELPLKFENLTYVVTSEDSKALNPKNGPMIIIGSSGMMEGGRILHHLKNRIEDPETMLVITGYQAAGTLGRKIQDGISPVRILGEMRAVNAEVIVMDEFSAHADRDGLFNYVKSVPGLKKVFLVHGESDKLDSFKKLLNEKLPNLQVETPLPGSSYEV